MRPGQVVSVAGLQVWIWIDLGFFVEVAAVFDDRVRGLGDGARAIVVLAGRFVFELDILLDGEDDIFTVASGERDGGGAVAFVEVRPVPGVVEEGSGLLIYPAQSGVRQILYEFRVGVVGAGS